MRKYIRQAGVILLFLALHSISFADPTITTCQTGIQTRPANVIALYHFNFDEDPVRDSSDNNSPGTLKGAGEPNFVTAGKFGGCYEFDGDDDWIALADQPYWDFAGNDFTIMYWEFRTELNAGSDFAQTFARDRTTIYVPWVFGYDNGSGALLTYMSDDGSSWNIANGESLGTAVINTWMHYAIVRTNNDFFTYQNGVQIDTWSSARSFPANANSASIGSAQGDAASYYFKGKIEELLVITGAFLTQAEIQHIYNRNPRSQ